MDIQQNQPCAENMRTEHSDLHLKGELEERPMKSFARWARNLLIEEKGGVLIIVAFLLFFVFLGMVAFSVDVGYLYLQRRHQQSTADAAALAAAWELPWYAPVNGETSIETTAKSYVVTNNIDNAEIEVTPPGGDIRKVKVEITKEYPLFFAAAPPISQTEADVYAMAVATRRMPGMDLLPFTLLDYDEDKHVHKKYDAIIGDEYRYYKDSEGNLNYDDPYYDDNYNRVNPNRDLGGYEEYKDWADNKEHFFNLLNDKIVPVEIKSWILSSSSGNFGLVDMGDFSDSSSVTSGNINHNAIKYILENGLDRPFCVDSDVIPTRSTRPGYIAAINNKGPVGIPLEERLKRDKDEGFYIILLTPKKGAEVQGNNNLTSFNTNEFVIGYVNPLELNNDGNLVGTLIEVLDCENLDASSWHNRVILIE